MLGKGHVLSEGHDPSTCQDCLAERLAQAMQACGHDVYAVDLQDSLDDAGLVLRVASEHGHREAGTDR